MIIHYLKKYTEQTGIVQTIGNHEDDTTATLQLGILLSTFVKNAGMCFAD